MSSRVLSILVVGAGLWSLPGCAASDPADDVPEHEAVYSLTIVNLEEDGTDHVKVVAITASQQRDLNASRAHYEALAQSADPDDPLDAERVASAAQAISRDSGCSGTSMWAYAQPDLEGQQICFSGHGYASLESYGWAGDVMSYWAGQYGGGWYEGWPLIPPPYSHLVESFNAYGKNEFFFMDPESDQVDWLLQ